MPLVEEKMILGSVVSPAISIGTCQIRTILSGAKGDLWTKVDLSITRRLKEIKAMIWELRIHDPISITRTLSRCK
jgi:hypothetical protein